MLCNQLITSDIPIVHPEDHTGKVLSLMEHAEVQELPVVAEDRFMGIISQKNILDLDGREEVAVAKIMMQLNKVSVRPEDHFLFALKVFSEADISVLPVVGKDEIFEGSILPKSLLQAAAQLNGLHEFQGGLIVLEMDRNNFSFTEISRMVEVNETNITQLNTYTEDSSGLYIVTIRVNKADISNIISTFQRHDISIRYYFGEESYQNELKENYDALIHYLNI